jgi:hypothetical protein
VRSKDQVVSSGSANVWFGKGDEVVMAVDFETHRLCFYLRGTSHAWPFIEAIGGVYQHRARASVLCLFGS